MSDAVNFDRDTVRHYAKLAHLHFSDAELDGMAQQMGTILDYVKKIAELDLKDVPATTQIFGDPALPRTDEPRLGIGNEAALANAPDTEGGHFLVPKVISIK